MVFANLKVVTVTWDGFSPIHYVARDSLVFCNVTFNPAPFPGYTPFIYCRTAAPYYSTRLLWGNSRGLIQVQSIPYAKFEDGSYISNGNFVPNGSKISAAQLGAGAVIRLYILELDTSVPNVGMET